MFLLHQEMFPQATLQGWQKGNERCRPKIRPAARFCLQGKGNVLVLSNLIRPSNVSTD